MTQSQHDARSQSALVRRPHPAAAPRRRRWPISIARASTFIFRAISSAAGTRARVETVAAPLFPRYVFVAVDLAAQRWRSIYSTVGVARLVCNGDDPAAVPDAVVAALRSREDASGFIGLDSRPAFRPGDKVRVLDGAFSSCLGLFDGMAERERIAILLDLLGRKVRVVLDADLVAAA